MRVRDLRVSLANELHKARDGQRVERKEKRKKKSKTNLNQFTRRRLEKHLLSRRPSSLEVDHSFNGRSRLVLSGVKLGSIWHVPVERKGKKQSQRVVSPSLLLVPRAGEMKSGD